MQVDRPDPFSAAAAAAERRRLARELHDTLGYTLTISMVQLENATELINEEPRQALALIETVREYLSSGLDALHLTLTTLRNDDVRAADLLSTLQQLIRTFAAATGIVVEAAPFEALPFLSDGQATTLYRAVQEALLNTHKHSQAKNIRIVLDSDEQAVALTVEDDGQWCARSAGEGYGLTGMRERAEALGGTFSVMRPPGGGVTVTLRLPLKGEVYD